MKICRFTGLTAVLVFSCALLGQSAGAPNPQDPVPGLIARIHIAGEGSNIIPTHLMAVIQNGQEFNDVIKPLAETKLRAVASKSDSVYVAIGFIILDKDTDVSFEMGNNNCVVNRKDFGPGTYTQPMKKGKYTLEIKRKDHGQPQGKFVIKDATTGQPVLFHNGVLLSKELKDSVKLEGKTRKTEQIIGP